MADTTPAPEEATPPPGDAAEQVRTTAPTPRTSEADTAVPPEPLPAPETPEADPDEAED